MKLSKIIEEIHTVRDFKKETVERKIIEDIIETGKNTQGLAGGRNSSILFVDNGSELTDKLSGKAGYYGRIIEAPHYLVITTKEFPGFMENSGYIMEIMRLKAWEMGVASCWLSIEDEEALKQILNIENDSRVTAFAAIGYQYKGIFKTDISQKSSRHGIEEIIYMEKWGNTSTFELLETRGLANIFHHTKFAPSWGNKQPWRFVINENTVLLAVKKEDKMNVRLDAGIVMLYFEKAAHEEGIKGSWDIHTDKVSGDTHGIPENYEVIGCFNI